MISLRRSILYGRNSFFRYGIVLHIIIIISIYISYKLMYKLDYIEGNSLNNYDFKNKSRNLVKRKKGEEEHINIIDKNSILKKLSENTYKGIWKYSFENDYSNFIFLSFKNKKNSVLKIEINQITENYLVNWNRIIGEIEKENFTFFQNEEKNTIEFGVSFKAKVKSGKITNSFFSENLCTVDLQFQIQKHSEFNFNILNGNISSICREITNCDFKIKKFYDDSYDFIIFFLFSVLIVFLNDLNTLCVKKRFNENLAEGICLFTIYENIRHYLCFIQLLFNYVLNLNKYTILFWIILIINYPYFDVNFFHLIWRLKYKEQLNNPNIRKKIMCKSIFSFFFVTLFSLLSFSRFYFSKENYFISSILTFTPQIIYNIIYENEISIPHSICFCNYLSKIFILYYFNIYENNILLIKNEDSNFIYLIIGIYIITFLFLLSQKIFGPKWFIPFSERKKKNDIFKSKKEILNSYPQLINEICVICLSPLFNEEKENTELTIDLYNSKDLEKKELNGNKEGEEKIKFRYSFKEILLSFFEFEANHFKLIKTPYILLECHHCFHFDCVLNWLKKKNFCPTCRSPL